MRFATIVLEYDMPIFHRTGHMFLSSNGHLSHSVFLLFPLCLLSVRFGRQSCRQLLSGKFTHCFQFFESSNDRTRPCIEWVGVRHSIHTRIEAVESSVSGLWEDEGSPFTGKCKVCLCGLCYHLH